MIYGVVISSPPSESHLLQWLATILHYLFTGLWVLPVFWISKPINVIWFQDIASAALHEKQKQQKTNKPAPSQTPTTQSVSQTISRFIADLLFSVLLQLLFLLQAMVVGVVPGLGWLLSLLHMTILYSLYCFEYKWMHDGWPVHQRIAFIETRWPYFIGFGLPLTFLTALPNSLVISASVFAVSFPLFIISATSAKPSQSRLPPLPIFNIVIKVTNKLASRSSRTHGKKVAKLAPKYH
jgi:etoposide-induced 2.4 mRNA